MNLFNAKIRNKEDERNMWAKSNLSNSLPLKYIFSIYIEVDIAVVNVLFLFKDYCFVQVLVGEISNG